MPYNEKNALRRRYRIRATTVFFFTLSVAVLVGIGSLVPTFVRTSSSESSAIKQAVLKEKDQETQFEQIKKSMSSKEQLLSVLSSGMGGATYSTVIENIARARGRVLLKSLSLTNAGTTTLQVAISGFAPTRKDLLDFKGRLTANPGTKVDMPVSSLAKSSDISFAINITVQTK